MVDTGRFKGEEGERGENYRSFESGSVWKGRGDRPIVRVIENSIVGRCSDGSASTNGFKYEERRFKEGLVPFLPVRMDLLTSVLQLLVRYLYNLVLPFCLLAH